MSCVCLEECITRIVVAQNKGPALILSSSHVIVIDILRGNPKQKRDHGVLLSLICIPNKVKLLSCSLLLALYEARRKEKGSFVNEKIRWETHSNCATMLFWHLT